MGCGAKNGLVFIVAAWLWLLPLSSSNAAPRVGMTAWQEITVLTVSRLEAAVSNCGFKINGERLRLLIESADMTLNDVHDRPRSDALRQRIEDSVALYRTDRDTACATAWDLFGADGQARDYLVR